MKKLLSIACCLSLVVCMLSYVYAQDDLFASDEGKPVYDMEQEAYYDRQMYNLILYFEEQGLTNREHPYPDFYGGAYVTDDRSDLIICVTDDSDIVCDIIKNGTQNQNVTIRKVENSYNELVEESRSILDNFSAISAEYTSTSYLNGIEPIQIIGAGVSIANNCVTVTVKNDSSVVAPESLLEDEVYNLIENVSVANEGKFQYIVETGDYIVEQTTYDPGSTLSSSAGSFTMGYKGIIEDPSTGKNVKGFWTAGHCVYNEGNTVYYGSGSSRVAIGSCLVRQNSGSVDAAFIKLDDQEYTIISSTLKYGDKTLTSSSYFTSFYEEQIVYICGSVCEEQVGSIKNTSYSFYNADQVRFDDFCVANYRSYDGDSGGAIYSLINGDYALCGIHKGLDPENSAKRVFSKTSNINDVWKMYEWNE